MKNFILLLILSSNLVWASGEPTLMSTYPPKLSDMVQKFPHTKRLVSDCFAYPKINIEACKELANVDHPGSSYAKHNVGFAYEYGREGLKKNYTEAFYWYLRASNQGNADSSHNLARMYEFGMGVQVSLLMAHALYLKAHNTDWWGHEKSFDRAAILTLVLMNQRLEKGLLAEKERTEYMNLLKPWQVKAANTYFD